MFDFSILPLDHTDFEDYSVARGEILLLSSLSPELSAPFRRTNALQEYIDDSHELSRQSLSTATPSLVTTEPSVASSPIMIKSVDADCVGGTFDHMHYGHKVLLTMAALLCTDRLVCGVADDVLLQNKQFKEEMEPLLVCSSLITSFCSCGRQIRLDTFPKGPY
eukprot:m.92462 g.92462  ORF g.92462 m.92462 type:complete len:164 (+) comp51161_c0_seq10:460-951(+)